MSDDAYWWEKLLGNLAISINEDIQSEPLMGEVLELAERIELLIGR